MPAVYVSPGGGTSYPIFQTSTRADQIGVNASPASCPGVNWSPLTGSANVYLQASSTDATALTVYKQITQTQRNYDGSDTIRLGQCTVNIATDCDHNDPTVAPTQIVSRGLVVNARYGQNAPTYGSGLGIYMHQTVVNSGSPINEFAGFHGYVQIGTAAAPTNARNWGAFDWGTYGPIGLQPSIFGGGSLVIGNYYNGSPTLGLSCGLAIQSLLASGPGGNPAGASNNYPVDVGYCETGKSTGGTGDGFTTGFMAGGQPSYWTGDPAMAGDQGQLGKGFVVRAVNAGSPVTRLGGFVSEGTGEPGGLVFGRDTTDANRVSISRPTSGVMTLRGKVSFANGGYAASTTATPSNVAGKIAIYNDSGTLLGYLPIYGSL